MREETEFFRMATLEPLRSAIAFGSAGETSLEVPSDRDFRSAKQRVLDQVHSIKRTKSKYSSKSGSGTLSPTSPSYDSVFYDQSTMKMSPVTVDGGVFSRGKASINDHSKMRQMSQRRTTVTRGSSSQRSLSTSSKKERVWSPNSPPAMNWSTSQREKKQITRSFPDLSPVLLQRAQVSQTSQVVRAGSANKISRTPVNQFSVRRPPSMHSTAESRVSVSKSKNGDLSGLNGGVQVPDITMKEAVEFLYSPDEAFQQCGASYIQHTTYMEEKAKEEVLRLKGIAPLVAILGSPNLQVQETAAAALRNLVFKSSPNKEEVQKCGGITQAINVLKETNSAEIQKHLTGLLWNLSSSDSLKPELVRSAVPVLTEKVVVPFTADKDQNANSSNVDPEVFYNTTACLRNLSSGKTNSRQALRNSRGLIDSLVSYVRECADSDLPNDKSVENCVCVLHNLTYQLESEVPSLFTKMNSLAGFPSRGGVTTTPSSPIGCFSSQSNRIKQESCFDFPVIEENNPKGTSRLFHSKTLQTYLSLLRSSENEKTLEACSGALHNLTASNSVASGVLSQTIVQKLNGLQQISALLQSENTILRNNAVSILGNISKIPHLRSSLARQSLPQLVGLLSSGVTHGSKLTESDNTMATTCHSVLNLLKSEPELGKRLLNNTLINSLKDLSQNTSLPKTRTAASVLLYSLWSDKDFQSFLRKQGMNKTSFVNDMTTAAFRSVQVIE
ncbi:plakophilin-1 [Chanos chanos]|uniref:Plakophilin-1 n=1 Tax=Chanos chanos TaxID=29144 RepID=A0A6J2VM69_CHACN|nr:plakophilin-1-like [Chanos chanos]